MQPNKWKSAPHVERVITSPTNNRGDYWTTSMSSPMSTGSLPSNKLDEKTTQPSEGATVRTALNLTTDLSFALKGPPAKNWLFLRVPGVPGNANQ